MPATTRNKWQTFTTTGVYEEVADVDDIDENPLKRKSDKLEKASKRKEKEEDENDDGDDSEEEWLAQFEIQEEVSPKSKSTGPKRRKTTVAPTSDTSMAKLVSAFPHLLSYIMQYYELPFHRHYLHFSPSLQHRVYKKHGKYLVKLLYGVLFTPQADQYQRNIVLLFPSISLKCSDGALNNTLGYHYAVDYDRVLHYILPKKDLLALDISHSYNYVIDIGSLLCTVGQSLTSLDLCACRIGNFDTLAQAFQSMKKLKRIDLSTSVPIVKEDFIKIFSTPITQSIQNIQLVGQTKLDDECVDLVLRDCTKLKSLNLDGVPITEKALEKVQSHKNLETLKLFSNSLEDPKPKIDNFTPCPTIKSIDIASYDISDTTLAALFQHEKLEKLALTYVDLSSTFWKQIGCTKVHTLTLDAVDSSKVQDESIEEAILSLSRMSALINVSMAMHAGILVKAICTGKSSNIFAARLTRFDVSRCSNLTDDALESFLAKAVNLRELKVDGCSRAMTLRGVKAVTKHKNIRELTATTCRISDEGSSLLFEAENLRVLNLANNRITEKSIWLLQKNKSLVELDLSGNSMGENGIRALFANTNALQVLSISIDNKISTEVLATIKKNRSIYELHVHFNEMANIVGDEGGKFALERKFLLGCPHIQELYMVATPKSF
jgi:Leucine-rich repeat (LRR) protein